jgi:hypothetical protein
LQELLGPLDAAQDRVLQGRRHSNAAIGPSLPPVTRKYSAGARRICSPRIPAEIDTTSNSSIVSFTV